MSFYHEPKRNRITVGDPGSDYQGFDADAIDRAAAYCRSRGGGSIKLSPGIYHIDHAVRLGSHVRLIGSGEDTRCGLQPEAYLPGRSRRLCCGNGYSDL